MLVTNNWFLVPFSTIIALICMGGLFGGFVVLDEIRFSQTWWRLQLALTILLHGIAIFSVTGIVFFFGGFSRTWLLWSIAIILVLNIFPIIHQLAGLREGEVTDIRNAVVEKFSGTKYSNSTSKHQYKVAILAPDEKKLWMPARDWWIAYHDCEKERPYRMAGLPIKDRLVRWQCTGDSPWRDATMVAACEPECGKTE